VTDRGVMCLDVHPVHSNLIVVGFYDGMCTIYIISMSTLVIFFCSFKLQFLSCWLLDSEGV